MGLLANETECYIELEDCWKENVVSVSECLQVLFVNLINWVNILARFYEKLSWGISIENISFCWRPARWGGREGGYFVLENI